MTTLADVEDVPALVRQRALANGIAGRLGPNLDELGMAVPGILDAISTTLQTFWRPVGDGTDLPSGAEKAAWLARYIATSWDELGRRSGVPRRSRALPVMARYHANMRSYRCEPAPQESPNRSPRSNEVVLLPLHKRIEASSAVP
jgi:hypothetical protein